MTDQTTTVEDEPIVDTDDTTEESATVDTTPVAPESVEELLLLGIDPTITLPEKTKARKHPALILTLGGAPNAPHILAGIPGQYRPDRATAVGGPGECSEEQAQALHETPGCPVGLVWLTDKELQAAREGAAEDFQTARGGLQDARAAAVGGEVEYVQDNIDATKGA